MYTPCTGKLNNNCELYFRLSHSITSFIKYSPLILFPSGVTLSFSVKHKSPSECLDLWTRYGYHCLFVIIICTVFFNIYFSPNMVEWSVTCYEFFKGEKVLLMVMVVFFFFKTDFSIETVQLSYFYFAFTNFYHLSLCSYALGPFNANFGSNQSNFSY